MKYTCCMCGEPTDNEEEMCDKCKIEYGYVERKKCIFCGKEIEQDKTVCTGCEKAYETMLFQQKQEKKRKKEEAEQKNPLNMMYCTDCGKKISRSAMFCPNCGRPFKENQKKEEKVVLENSALRAVCYVTDIISFCICGGVLVPLFWGIGFAIYCSGVDQSKYDIDFYKELRNQNFIMAVVIVIFYMIALVLGLFDN